MIAAVGAGREAELKNQGHELPHFLMRRLDMELGREKINWGPRRPRYIQTVWGAGYRYKGPSRGISVCGFCLRQSPRFLPA